jgi:hypothetical protein
MNIIKKMAIVVFCFSLGAMHLHAQKWIESTSAFIAVGDTTKQIELNTALNDTYISRDEMDAFFKNPVLLVSKIRLNPELITGNWEHVSHTCEIVSFSFGMRVNQERMSISCNGNTLTNEMIQTYQLNKNAVTALYFTSISVREKKSGKTKNLNDLVLRLKPQMSVACENIEALCVIYAGYSNKLRLSTSGVLYSNQITYEGVGVELQKVDDHTVLVKTSSVGKKGIIVKYLNKNIDTIWLEAIALPVPRFQLDQFTNNSSLSMDEIRNSIPVILMDAIYPIMQQNVHLLSFTLIVHYKGKQQSYACADHKISADALKFIETNARNVEKLEFTNIVVNANDGNVRLVPVSYYLKK